MKLFYVYEQKPVPSKGANPLHYQRVLIVRARSAAAAKRAVAEACGTVWPIVKVDEITRDVILLRA